ncbi:MAG: 30S ribosomal protein S12 methylthiotransferase RimO [Deferribacteres bacterium]|nr:30S ribosomal protein S12 methylthiotransferase RimO [candidate division KSB1 bacterium]MCB9510244.1 30S ribosomal protein S12 methylthiotransferase RimO [Deferribacteres bacterium]
MKIKLITLGCAKNLVDSEVIAGGLQANGVQFTDEADAQDAIIINTCGFIDSAKEESIETILDAVSLKNQGKCARVIVTGCLSERYGDELKKEIPEIDGLYGNRDLKKIVRDIAQQLDLKSELLGERQLLSPKHYAYLKISEGCEHPCTFCAIPGIRGNFRSQPIEKLVREANLLAEQGVRELVLIAQDTTVYGMDYYGEKKLPALLRALNKVDGIEWLRLMYAYPYHVTDELIETIASSEKVCKYVDMPVQHVSSKMLKRMARRMNGEKQHRLIEKMRAAIPDFALRTSVIVGFPGETDEDFTELYDYVSDGWFDRLGVFTYSQEDGTPAATFPDQVPVEVMRNRQDMLIQAQDETQSYKNQQLIGKKLMVLIDEYDRDEQVFRARTAWDCPEIDQNVLIREACQVGAFYDVEIEASGMHDLTAKILNKSKGKALNWMSTQLPLISVT